MRLRSGGRGGGQRYRLLGPDVGPAEDQAERPEQVALPLNSGGGDVTVSQG
jgi:hypothetical protein